MAFSVSQSSDPEISPAENVGEGSLIFRKYIGIDTSAANVRCLMAVTSADFDQVGVCIGKSPVAAQ